MKTFYNVVNSIICYAKEACTSIVLNIEWVQFVLQNCEKRYSARGMCDKKQRLIVLCISDVMYKRLVYSPPDLLKDFVK